MLLDAVEVDGVDGERDLEGPSTVNGT